MKHMLPASLKKLLNREEPPAVSGVPAVRGDARLPAVVQNLVMTREDREFLPAALEILETPPSPVKMAVINVIAALVAVSLLWAFWGRLDVIAIAQGKVQPIGRAKVVQPPETGRVLRIRKQNGDHVLKDEILVEFDPTEARADREVLEAAVTALKAEITRRDAVLQSVSEHGVKTTMPLLFWPPGIPVATQQREQEVMTADLSQLAAAIGSLEAQRVQKRRERQRLVETIAAQEMLVHTQRERVTMRSTLANSGYGTKAAVIDSREALQKEETTLASYSGQLIEADAALEVLERDRTRHLQTFSAEYTQKRADAQRTLDEASQKLAKAISRLGNLALRAPSDGTVQASTLYTVGQVVSVGQDVMRIVPEGGEMEVEAYIANRDIGFLRVGQEVSVKIDSFPFTRYGMLTGKVVRIASDAIPSTEASQIETNAPRSGEGMLVGGAQRMQNLVFPITVSLQRSHFVIDGQRVNVSAGMTVIAEIKTGSRRIIEYLFSPLYEVASESMRER